MSEANKTSQPKSKMLVTIIVCTYNRASLLEKTLQALLAQKTNAEYEIVVIDNNSTDRTKEAVKKVAHNAEIPVRYYIEKEQGISSARNRGAQEARGEYIAYIDDDAIASENWLREIINSFENTEPKPACCVGKVELQWEQGRSKWFPQEHETLLGQYDFGNTLKFLGPDDYLVTMNVAFQKESFLKIGEFRTYLGRKGNCLLSGEDNNMYQRFYSAGALIYYNPNQLIYHLVPKERQTLCWLTKRMFWDGATQILLDFENCKINKKNYLSKSAYDFKTTLINIFCAIFFVFLLNKDKSIHFFLKATLRAGRIYMAFIFLD